MNKYYFFIINNLLNILCLQNAKNKVNNIYYTSLICINKKNNLCNTCI